MLAWTPARNAPSTSGASLTRTRARSAGVEPLEGDLEAEQRAAEVEQDERRRRRRRRGPTGSRLRSAGRSSRSGRRPCRRRVATGTSDPPNWATIARNPSTSCSLCETRTRPTKHASFRWSRCVDARPSSDPDSSRRKQEPIWFRDGCRPGCRSRSSRCCPGSRRLPTLAPPSHPFGASRRARFVTAAGAAAAVAIDAASPRGRSRAGPPDDRSACADVDPARRRPGRRRPRRQPRRSGSGRSRSVLAGLPAEHAPRRAAAGRRSLPRRRPSAARPARSTAPPSSRPGFRAGGCGCDRRGPGRRDARGGRRRPRPARPLRRRRQDDPRRAATGPTATALRRCGGGRPDDAASAARATVDAARDGMRRTRPLIARRGIALRLGERSVGHLDPGAVSCFLILRALAGR